MNAPYSLAWGTSVHAKVVTYNVYGDSLTSDAGNGAIIYTYADAPLDLTETIAARTSSTITFTWSEGADNGGSSVIDYRVSYDNAVGTFVVLASNVVGTTYTATGLNYGLIYTFHVEARNEFGYSAYSDSIAILCATSPEKPETPTTTVVTNYVIFNWDAPIDNGTPISSYQVYIR
jgi:hypothetical protein